MGGNGTGANTGGVKPGLKAEGEASAMAPTPNWPAWATNLESSAPTKTPAAVNAAAALTNQTLAPLSSFGMSAGANLGFPTAQPMNVEPPSSTTAGFAAFPYSDSAEAG